MSKVHLLVELDVRADQVREFTDMFCKEFIARSRTEDGCEYYDLWQSPDHPTKMTIVEIWSSQSALDTHLAQQWFAEWAPQMEAMQVTPPMVRSMVSAG